RGLHLAGPDELVEREANLGPVAVAEPADPGRETLEFHPLLGELDPPPEIGIVLHDLEDAPVGRRDVLRIAGERDPAERALPDAEERPDVGRNEPRDL